MMKTKNIKVGMRIKNYAEICRLLDIKIQRGNGKTKQLNDFKRYFEWMKEGNAFIITKVYNKPKAFTEDEMIELLILNLLATADIKNNCTVIATKRSIFEKLNMVNSNFRYCIKNPNEVAIFRGIDENSVSDIMSSIDNSLSNKLKSALKRLSKRRILLNSDVYMICNFNENSHRVASDDEVSKCLEIERKIYKELKCEEYKDIIVKKLEKVYIKKFDEALSQAKIESFYRAIKIIFVRNEVPELLEKYLYKYTLSRKNYEDYKNRMNEGIKIQTAKNAKKRYDNAKNKLKDKSENLDEQEFSKVKNKISFGKPKQDWAEQEMIKREYQKEVREIEKLSMRADEDYLVHVESLIKLLIDGSTLSLIEEIRDTVKKYKTRESLI